MRNSLRNKLHDGLQKVLSYYLGLDPESTKRMAALQNKTVLIEMTGVNEKLFLHFAENKVSVLQEDVAPTPDTIIRGTPLRLLQLSLSKTSRQQFFSDDVAITGNLEAGQNVIRLFDEMDIDWEELLSKWIGDTVAFRIGSFTRRIKTWMSESKASLTQDLNDYLHEEKKVFPPAEALQDFYKDIDTLRLDADRVAARIQQLEIHLQERGLL